MTLSIAEEASFSEICAKRRVALARAEGHRRPALTLLIVNASTDAKKAQILSTTSADLKNTAVLMARNR